MPGAPVQTPAQAGIGHALKSAGLNGAVHGILRMGRGINGRWLVWKAVPWQRIAGTDDADSADG